LKKDKPAHETHEKSRKGIPLTEKHSRLARFPRFGERGSAQHFSGQNAGTMAKRIGLRRKYQAAEPRSFASALRPACIAMQSIAGRTTRSTLKNPSCRLVFICGLKNFQKKC
jgi:hypothetical protein